MRFFLGGHKFRQEVQKAKWSGPYYVVGAKLPIRLRSKSCGTTRLRAAARFWKFLRFLGPKSWIRGPNCLRLRSYLEVYQSNKSLTCVWKMDLFELFGGRFSPEISLRVGLTDALKTAGLRLWYKPTLSGISGENGPPKSSKRSIFQTPVRDL